MRFNCDFDSAGGFLELLLLVYSLLSCQTEGRHLCWLLVNTLTTICAMTSNGNFKTLGSLRGHREQPSNTRIQAEICLSEASCSAPQCLRHAANDKARATEECRLRLVSKARADWHLRMPVFSAPFFEKRGYKECSWYKEQPTNNTEEFRASPQLMPFRSLTSYRDDIGKI